MTRTRPGSPAHLSRTGAKVVGRSATVGRSAAPQALSSPSKGLQTSSSLPSLLEQLGASPSSPKSPAKMRRTLATPTSPTPTSPKLWAAARGTGRRLSAPAIVDSGFGTMGLPRPPGADPGEKEHIRVREDFMSNSSKKVLLMQGLRGTIRKYSYDDDDGCRFLVDFEGIYKGQWVNQGNFSKIEFVKPWNKKQAIAVGDTVMISGGPLPNLIGKEAKVDSWCEDRSSWKVACESSGQVVLLTSAILTKIQILPKVPSAPQEPEEPVTEAGPEEENTDVTEWNHKLTPLSWMTKSRPFL